MRLRLGFDVPELDEGARDCEAEVLGRWYDNTRDELDREYAPYEDATRFLTVSTPDGHVVGAMRLLVPGGAAGPKTLVDLAGPPWNLPAQRSAQAAGIRVAEAWDVATLVSRQSSVAGGTRVSLALVHGLVQVSRANTARWFVAVLDDRVRRVLNGVGAFTRPLPGATTAAYLGSAASTPVHLDMPATMDLQRRELPDAHRLVTLGIGLDGVRVPPTAHFVARPVVLDLTALEARERAEAVTT